MDLTNILFIKALNKGDATKEYVNEAIKALKGEVSADLDTLEELSKALGNDPDFFLSVKNELDKKITKDELDATKAEINQFKNEIVTDKDSATNNTKFAIGSAEQNLEVPSMEEFNELKGDKVDKDEIFNAGIRSISYVPLFGGSFTVTTVAEEGYIKPHAIATVTGRISKHYTYRVTINEEEYVLPCCLFSTRDNSGKVFEYLGNIELYTSDISGLMQDAIHNVPFCIISDLDGKKSIDVFTRSPCEVSITVEQMQKEQTPLPKSLIWGDDYCPIELKKYENSTFNGISIGCNILKSSKGTFAIGYGNEVSGQFGIAIGGENTVSGTCSLAEGYANTSSEMYSHAEGYKTKATKEGSHSEGFNTTASGFVSHSEGLNTTASGDTSHAEGYATTASGDTSHAEGSSSNAIGPCSHAEGQATKANGAMSHSGGNKSITDGRASFAHGNFSKATQPAQFAVGYGNDPQEDSIFEVGNGLNADGAPNNTGNTEPVTRQNAFRVTQSGVAIAQTGLQIGNAVINEVQLKKILDLEVPTMEEFNQLAQDVTGKLSEPAEGLAVGKYFRVSALDTNGHAVLEAVDAKTVGVQDVQVEGASVVVDGVANVPIANEFGKAGVVKLSPSGGIKWSTGIDALIMDFASQKEIDDRVSNNKPLIPYYLDYAVKVAMCDGKGAAWTADEQAAARERIGIPGGYELIEEIVTTEEINAIERSIEPDGTPYKFSAVFIKFHGPASDKQGGTLNVRYYMDSISIIAYITDAVNTEERFGISKAVRVNGYFEAYGSQAASTGHSSLLTLIGTTYSEYLTKQGNIDKITLNLQSSKNFLIGTQILIYGVRA